MHLSWQLAESAFASTSVQITDVGWNDIVHMRLYIQLLVANRHLCYARQVHHCYVQLVW